MRTITAIEPQQKNPQRVNVYLDGEFAFGLYRLTAGWLRVGQSLTDEKAAALQAEDAGESLYQKALHFLSYRPRSKQEVRRNLLERGAEASLVEETLERLERAGLVDDPGFARLWIENRNTFRPRGRAALRLELKHKGLEDEVIQAALEELVNEQGLARQAAHQQARRYAGLEWEDFRQKLGAHLARRGFSYAIIAPVVSEVWDETRTADPGRPILNED